MCKNFFSYFKYKKLIYVMRWNDKRKYNIFKTDKPTLCVLFCNPVLFCLNIWRSGRKCAFSFRLELKTGSIFFFFNQKRLTNSYISMLTCCIVFLQFINSTNRIIKCDKYRSEWKLIRFDQHLRIFTNERDISIEQFMFPS